MKRLLILGTAFAGMAVADMPTLTWTDIAMFPGGTTLGCCTSLLILGPLTDTAFSTDTGLRTTEVLNFFPGITSTTGFTIDRTFTVTSPGTFFLASSLDFNGEACVATCGSTGFAADLTGTVKILGPSTFAQSLAAVGTTLGGELDLHDQDFAPIFLGVGDYTLEQDYTQDLSRFVFPSSLKTGGGINTTLTSTAPVPEPRRYPVALAIGLLIVFKLNSTRLRRRA